MIHLRAARICRTLLWSRASSRRRQKAESERQKAEGRRQQIRRGFLPTAYCLLPPVFSTLPIARIPPIHLVRGGEICADVMKLILANVRSSHERRADFEAQIGSLKTGSARLLEIVARRGTREASEYAEHLISYSS